MDRDSFFKMANIRTKNQFAIHILRITELNHLHVIGLLYCIGRFYWYQQFFLLYYVLSDESMFESARKHILDQ